MLALIAPSAEARRRVHQKRKREKVVSYPMLDEPTQFAAAACGNPKLRADVDWATFRPQLRDSFTADVAAGLCGAVLEGMKVACQRPDRKGRPRKRIARVRCRYKRGALRLQVEKRGKELWVSYTSETPNLADDMRDWLLSHY